MSALPPPAGDAIPWLLRRLRPVALAVLISAWLCIGAVLAAFVVFFVSQAITEERP